jgi:hypothetical protein
LKPFLSALFIFTLALGGVVALAQDQATQQPQAPPQTAPAQTVSGTVVSSGNISFSIRTDDGTVRTFLITSTTGVPGGGFAPGDSVTVAYQPIDDEHAAATSIAVVGGQPSTGTATSGASSGVVSDTTDHSETWRTLALAGMIVLLVALGVTMLAGLARTSRTGRHTTV